jgi:hypothetical protein
MSQPTPSQAINTLVELATNVANKKAEPEVLHKLVNQRLEMLLASREDFETKAEAMGEGFTIPAAPLIDRVHECYDAYEQSLKSMLGYFESGNAKDLHLASQTLIDIAVPMAEAVQEYVKELVAFGPSPYPLLNAATNILRSVLTQGVPVEALNIMVEDTVAHNTKAIAEIDASPLGQKEGYQDKRVAIEAISDAVKALKPVQSEDEIEPAVADLKRALELMTAADTKIFEETAAKSPTPMPAANVLINTARGVLDGTYTLETMDETLTWYRTFLEAVQDQFDAAVEGETDSVVILEELPKTREIIDLHDEVIEDLMEAMGDFTAETVEPILEELIVVIERLRDSSQVYMDMAQREGKLVCVSCGHPNPPTNRSCEECGQRLPQLVDPNLYATSTLELEERSGLAGDEPTDGVVTENTYKLFEACEKFFAQKITEAEFRGMLQWSRGQVELSERKVKAVKEVEVEEAVLAEATQDELDLLEANRKLLQDTRLLYEEGVDDWVEGLDLMEDYIETRHRPTLELGIQKVWAGSQKLHSIQRIGDFAQRALDEREQIEKTLAAMESHEQGSDDDHDDGPPVFEQHEYREGEGGLA